jgi:hypothetical protein
MAELPTSKGIVRAILCDEYFTPEARALCARIKHKPELTDDELLMLAMAAAQAALARYWYPGERSAEEALVIIEQILDHDDVVATLNGCRNRKMSDDAQTHKPTLD